MGDHYRSSYRRARSPPGRNDSYERYQRGGDERYMPNAPHGLPYRNRYDTRSRSPQRHQSTLDRYHGAGDGGGFAFRGAADRDRHPPHQQPQFTFNAPGPRFPPPPQSHTQKFPSANSARSGPKADSNARPQVSRAEENRRNESYRGKADTRRGGIQNSRQRGGFRPRAAHTRDILHRRRGNTPEQLSGMSEENNTHFTTIDLTDNDDNVIDLTQDSDYNDENTSRKRIKVDADAEQAARPQWSNPDPYTSLPPTENTGGPKRDIVKLIRKAKVENADKTDSKNGVANNVDFISLNDTVSEEGEAPDDESGTPPEEQALSPRLEHALPRRPQRALPPRQHADERIAFSIAEARKSRAISGDNIGPPPPPPPGLVLPTEDELVSEYSNGPKGRKRKREEQSIGLGDLLPEWMPSRTANRSEAAPWYSIDRSATAKDGLRSLHKEIRDFYEFVRPLPTEESARRDLVVRVNKAVQKHNHLNLEVKCFGSFASGIYLPTADMDLVAVSTIYQHTGEKTAYQSSTKMHKLSAFLIGQEIAAPESVTVIGKAKVPIIKFVDGKTRYRVDISFENNTGLVANTTFKDWKAEYPTMPLLVLLIKQLIAMRGLNEVHHGGLGGFSVICLVVSMLQNMPEAQYDNMDPEQYYAHLLLNFLDLYGNRFDITRTGITMDPPGYFDKIRNPAKKQNANNLTIIDPNNPYNDISGGSRNVKQVLKCFSNAHAAIQRRLAQIANGHYVQGSILECVLGGNYSSYGRRGQPAHGRR